MRCRSDPALAQALSQPEAAQRWAAWRGATGPYARQTQSAHMWQGLGASGARAVLYHHLSAVRKGKGKGKGKGKRVRAAALPLAEPKWRTPKPVLVHW